MEWVAPTSIADASPRSIVESSSPDELTGQFVLARSSDYLPSGWPVRRTAGWVLATHPALRIADIVGSGGEAIGWMLGPAIAQSGAMLSTRVTAPSLDELARDESAFESFVYSHGGRFLAIRAAGPQPRVYHDPASSLSAVYVPDLAMLAATPSLVPYLPGFEDNLELIATFRLTKRSGVYPFGLTHRRGVERLLPNFYLDLSTWTSHRHWPRGPLHEEQDPAEAVSIVSRILTRHVDAIAAVYPLRAGLTAGMDTRMILSHTRHHQDHIVYSTLEIPDRGGRVDLAISRELARRFRLNHVVSPYREATERDLARWQYRAGCAVGEMRGWQSATTYTQVDPDRAEMSGVVANMGRSTKFWRHSGYGKKPLTPELLFETLVEPTTPELLERASRWLSELPVDRTMSVLDLLFIEQRLGCWGGILPYTEPGRIYPFTHREILHACLRMPDRYRVAKRFPADLIASKWPELLSVPFNREIGLKHYVRRARRMVWLARKRLRYDRGADILIKVTPWLLPAVGA